MHGEREELVKRVFPHLRRLCESRGVAWSEVDLRWGVTDEQKAEGKVLPICLAEIERCRPQFIALLAERYGFVPDEFDPALVEREPWLAEHRERSVTELEILHGVLNNPEKADHAFFYFRSPTFIQALPADQQSDFREGPTTDEIERYGRQQAERRAEDRRQKLARLKERIRASGLPVREDYADPQRLGELVLRDLTAVIDRRYPEGSQPDPLDREASGHEVFAASRARVYIGREEYSDRLDAHVQGEGPPLLVLGESGSGKSALLANWVMRRDARPGEVLLAHFVEATPLSADWEQIVLRILRELVVRSGVGTEAQIPDAGHALRAAFSQLLEMAATKRKLVLVVDGVDQLEDRDSALDLFWLPQNLPANLRLILSSSPGHVSQEVQRRGWPGLMLRPLDVPEREVLITEFLAQYGKRISPGRVSRIAVADAASSVLYLRTLLEELRVYGDAVTLEHWTEQLLQAATVDELYQRILGRYEQDYERDRPGLVRDALSLIYAARGGLAEAEVLDLLGSGEPLPQEVWSPFHLTVEPSLLVRSGLISLRKDFRNAVQQRYLRRDAERRQTHLRLGAYLEAQRIDERRAVELLWQLAQAGEWRHVAELLADSPVLVAAWKANSPVVKKCWEQVARLGGLSILDAYRSVIERPESRQDEQVRVISQLLIDFGHRDQALRLQSHLVEHGPRTTDPLDVFWKSLEQARIQLLRGELDAAVASLREHEHVCRRWQETMKTEPMQMADNYNLQAIIALKRGDLAEALRKAKEAERIAREFIVTFCDSLGGTGIKVVPQGEGPEGRKLVRGLAEGFDSTGRAKQALYISLIFQAELHNSRNELVAAIEFLSEAEQISRELADHDGLQRVLALRTAIRCQWPPL